MEKSDTTKFRVQSAQDELQVILSRISSLIERHSAICDELEAKKKDLGKARLSGSTTAKIHQAITQLENEQREITAELTALEPGRVKAQAAVLQAEKEQSAAKYAELLAQVNPLGMKIIQELDQLHVDLCFLGDVQREMLELGKAAGSLATDPEDAPLAIPVPHIWHVVDVAMMRLIAFNGADNLKKHGVVIRDWLGEYSGHIKVER
jgi:phage-related tail protein